PQRPRAVGRALCSLLVTMAARRCVSHGKSLLWSPASALRRPCSQAPAVILRLKATSKRPATVAQTREMSFSFPGPRKLGDITNLPLLEKEEKENIADIWAAYHDERTDSLGTVIPGDALADLQAKAKKW
ncbi:unnamed protein product, partial [Hapterophycus canaliculatus]